MSPNVCGPRGRICYAPPLLSPPWRPAVGTHDTAARYSLACALPPRLCAPMPPKLRRARACQGWSWRLNNAATPGPRASLVEETALDPAARYAATVQRRRAAGAARP